jgi:hypothetical protein
MLVRSIPLVVCLAWLAYESHFSVSFFQQTVSVSLTSITQGIEQALGADEPVRTHIASAEN